MVIVYLHRYFNAVPDGTQLTARGPACLFPVNRRKDGQVLIRRKRNDNRKNEEDADLTGKRIINNT